MVGELNCKHDDSCLVGDTLGQLTRKIICRKQFVGMV